MKCSSNWDPLNIQLQETPAGFGFSITTTVFVLAQTPIWRTNEENNKKRREIETLCRRKVSERGAEDVWWIVCVLCTFIPLEDSFFIYTIRCCY